VHPAHGTLHMCHKEDMKSAAKAHTGIKMDHHRLAK